VFSVFRVLGAARYLSSFISCPVGTIVFQKTSAVRDEGPHCAAVLRHTSSCGKSILKISTLIFNISEALKLIIYITSKLYFKNQ